MPKRKGVKDCLKQLLNSNFKEENETLSGSMLLAKGLFNSAKGGNVPAIKALLEITEEQNENKNLSLLYKALDDNDV